MHSLKPTCKKSWRSNDPCSITTTPGFTPACISLHQLDTRWSLWTWSPWRSLTVRYLLPLLWPLLLGTSGFYGFMTLPQTWLNLHRETPAVFSSGDCRDVVWKSYYLGLAAGMGHNSLVHTLQRLHKSVGCYPFPVSSLVRKLGCFAPQLCCKTKSESMKLCAKML